LRHAAGPDDIEQAAISVGAFPLDRAWKDTTFIIELDPGAHTLHLTGANAEGSTALVEVDTLL